MSFSGGPNEGSSVHAFSLRKRVEEIEGCGVCVNERGRG